MNKQPVVVFRNVGQLYFPQSRVECHYSLTADHRWNNRNWIGIFKVGWLSVTEYFTYIWALAPEDYVTGTNVNFCAHFQAGYLPRPSEEDEYQFVYVDENGEVCALSRHFTFRFPKPLEELETMREERGEEDEEEGEGEDLLLVIPRAQLLQSQLERCQREQAEVKQAAEAERRTERETREEGRREWEVEKGAMREEISELRENLKHSSEKVKKVEGRQKDVQYTKELSSMVSERSEGWQRIKELEDDIQLLTDRGREGDGEIERMKERGRKMSAQMKHEEEKPKNMQDVQYTKESLSCELSSMVSERSEGRQRIKELEDDIQLLTDRGREADGEIERMKESGRKMSAQMKHEEEKRKNMQVRGNPDGTSNTPGQPLTGRDGTGVNTAHMIVMGGHSNRYKW